MYVRRAVTILACFEYDYVIVETKGMRKARTVGYINLLSDVDGVIALVEYMSRNTITIDYHIADICFIL